MLISRSRLIWASQSTYTMNKMQVGKLRPEQKYWDLHHLMEPTQPSHHNATINHHREMNISGDLSDRAILMMERLTFYNFMRVGYKQNLRLVFADTLMQ